MLQEMNAPNIKSDWDKLWTDSGSRTETMQRKEERSKNEKKLLVMAKMKTSHVQLISYSSYRCRLACENTRVQNDSDIGDACYSFRFSRIAVATADLECVSDSDSMELVKQPACRIITTKQSIKSKYFAVFPFHFGHEDGYRKLHDWWNDHFRLLFRGAPLILGIYQYSRERLCDICFVNCEQYAWMTHWIIFVYSYCRTQNETRSHNKWLFIQNCLQ